MRRRFEVDRGLEPTAHVEVYQAKGVRSGAAHVWPRDNETEVNADEWKTKAKSVPLAICNAIEPAPSWATVDAADCTAQWVAEARHWEVDTSSCLEQIKATEVQGEAEKAHKCQEATRDQDQDNGAENRRSTISHLYSAPQRQ